MILKEFQQSDYYKSRPAIVQEVFNILPPYGLYKITKTGVQCIICRISEPESNDLDDVKLTVVQTGVGGIFCDLGVGDLEKGTQITGVLIDDLEKWR